MQELVLTHPVGTVRHGFVRESAQADARREFEERLAECGPLAYRVARGVLRNTADAEDVAQEALLRRQQRDTLWSQPVHQPPAATAEDLAALSELQARLDRALGELPEKLRLVLLLAAMKGHTIDEIAEMLGISVGTVKSRIFYARKQLAEKLRCHVNATKTR